jgi:hypothetical protein
MTVSAISPLGVQILAPYSAVAPVSKTAAVRRAAKGETRKSSAKGPALAPSRSAEATSSSAVLTALSGLQTGG